MSCVALISLFSNLALLKKIGKESGQTPQRLLAELCPFGRSTRTLSYFLKVDAVNRIPMINLMSLPNFIIIGDVLDL